MTQTNTTKQKGMTLIELLVVIAIIGLFASLTSVGTTEIRKKGRDAKRIADLVQIRNVLELYYDDNGVYPILNGFTCISSNSARWDLLYNQLAPYIPKLPKDPVNTNVLGGPWTTGVYTYAYCFSIDQQTYDIVGQFENQNNPNRCEIKCPLYNTGAAIKPWCNTCVNGYNNSPYIFEL